MGIYNSANKMSVSDQINTIFLCMFVIDEF